MNFKHSNLCIKLSSWCILLAGCVIYETPLRVNFIATYFNQSQYNNYTLWFVYDTMR